MVLRNLYNVFKNTKVYCKLNASNDTIRCPNMVMKYMKIYFSTCMSGFRNLLNNGLKMEVSLRREHRLRLLYPKAARIRSINT